MGELLVAGFVASLPGLIALVVAVLVVKGPARLTAALGLALMVCATIASVFVPVLMMRTGAGPGVPSLAIGILHTAGWVLLALSVVHATVWARRAPAAPAATWGTPGLHTPPPAEH